MNRFNVDSGWDRSARVGGYHQSHNGVRVDARIVELTPADGWGSELSATVEGRTMADGTPIILVEVRRGQKVLMRWNTRDGQEGRYPDVTPNADTIPDSEDGRRRWAAWAAGERQRAWLASEMRVPVSSVRWDASCWQAAVDAYRAAAPGGDNSSGPWERDVRWAAGGLGLPNGEPEA